MSTPEVRTREDVLAPIATAFAEAAPDGGGAEFVARYFRHVPLDELTSRTADIYAGAAASHLELARHRLPGVANVRVYNPSTEADGWSNARTIIQVVTDDMPFLVDSVTGALVNAGIDIHLIVHPQLVVSRDAAGELEHVVPRDVTGKKVKVAVGELAESWMLLSIDRESDEARRALLERTVRDVLEDVRQSVEDWPKMRSKCLVLAAELEGSPPQGVDADETALAIRFLRWMADDHFTFLGFRDYTLRQTAEGEFIAPVTGSGLGLLRSDPPLGHDPDLLTPQASAKAHEPNILVLTKANTRSTVHRVTHLDYVGVKQYDELGQVVGERRFLGLYASTAYTESVMRVPLVAEKVHAVLERSGVAPDSHTGKDLLGVLESYPRDELIQAGVEQLYETAMSVTQLQERRRTKLFIREDDFGRFVSCLVYIPRDRYNTNVRLRMADILKDTFGGESVEFSARVSESALSRLQFVVRVPKGKRVRTLDRAEQEALEHRLVEVSRTWSDRLGDALRADRGEEEGDRLMDRFGRAFPTAYEETFSVNQGVADLSHLDRLGQGTGTSVALYRPADAPDDVRRFKLFRVDPLSLTDILPIFTHMGVEVVDEQPFEVARADGTTLHVYDFGLRVPDAAIWEECPHDKLRDLFEGAVAAVWDGRAESDGFNRLVLAAQLTWRQVVVLRAVAKYLRQTRATYSQDYLEDALVSHPAIARDLVELWEARFDPQRYAGSVTDERTAAEEEIAGRVVDALDDVSSLDHDRIIRAFLGVIRAGLRTNFYQPGADGEHKSYVSLKLNPKAVPDLPAPRPQFEIWVYSPRVEGVHLRFGPVARGGLRWSDRREDFRTEVLGLVKAQMVKNAVIVPTGSKGGFYPKQLPDPAVDREAWLEEGKTAYRMFISGLLDITDNRVSGAAVPPEHVVRHDRDDVYLVVAADKGTATFSDIANGVAQSYGFWLDDAFASGGSAGYDHKAMGITARGAWESVKRHFREMGVDTQSQDFTVVGVGDMSGDVFGNGMLLSEHIRLVAAFDHRHVFIDPSPDAAASFAERRRLFDLPRSSWDDYDKSLISAGGGVFPRHLKSIAVTPEMAEALGIKGVQTMTPGRADPRDPARPGRPALERRHRHLRQGLDRGPPLDRRPRQRRHPGRRQAAAGQGGRRGRQPRPVAARPHRGGVLRGAGQHRRHRQLGRCRHLRPRGQHQDPARRGRPAGPAHHRAAQRGARGDDRRRRRPRAARQLRAERAARQRPGAGALDGERARAAHPLARGPRRPRPRPGVPPDRRRDREAGARRAGPEVTGVLGAGGLRQARAQAGHPRELDPRRPVLRADPGRLLPAADPRELPRRARRPPAAPRDRHQRGRQLDGQPGRHHLRLPRAGGGRGHPRAGHPGVRRLP